MRDHHVEAVTAPPNRHTPPSGGSPRWRPPVAKAVSVACWATLLALAPTGAWAGLKETIAAKFNVDKDDFVLNLPPRPGCLPGSVFTQDLRVPISRTAIDDPKLDYGSPFQFTADADFDAGGSASVGVAAWLGLSAGAGSATVATMRFTDAKIVEMLGPELKRRVLADPDARASAAASVAPFAVIRAFLGRVEVTLAKRQGVSADVWGRLKQAAVSANAGAHVTNDDRVEISATSPIVFGFEVVRVTYLSTSLGTEVDDARLVPIPADLFRR